MSENQGHLPDDAERLGLTPLTAPGLEFASALASGSPRNRRLFLMLIAVIVVLALAVGLAALIAS